MNTRNLAKSVLAALVVSVLGATAMPSGAWAETNAQLQRRVQEMERQMGAMAEQLKKNAAVLSALKVQLKKNETKVEKVRREAKAHDPMESADSKWHLAGYASTSFRASDGDSREPTFLAGKFNPGFHFQYKDLLLFEAELEFEVGSDGKTELELEYSSLNIFATDFATIVAGKFLSPIGQFQERLHPDWINKLPDRPAGFGKGGVQPLSDVGAMVRGGFTVNPTFNYALFIGNGPQVELEDGELEALELEGFGRDDNGNKFVGGRLGILPIPHVEVGASFMTGNVEGKRVDGIMGQVSEGSYLLWGVDAAYTKGSWDARFEYLAARLGGFMSQAEPGMPTEQIPRTDWDAWYAQLAYKLSGLTERAVLRNLEPVVRYGELHVNGFAPFVAKGAPEERISVGLNYWFSPSIVWKFAASWRDFRDTSANDPFEIQTQLAFGF